MGRSRGINTSCKAKCRKPMSMGEMTVRKMLDQVGPCTQEFVPKRGMYYISGVSILQSKKTKLNNLVNAIQEVMVSVHCCNLTNRER